MSKTWWAVGFALLACSVAYIIAFAVLAVLVAWWLAAFCAVGLGFVGIIGGTMLEEKDG